MRNQILLLLFSLAQLRNLRCRLHTLSGASSSTGVSAHGDSLLVLLNVLEELHGALKLPSVDGLGGLTSVLERNTEIGTAGASRLRRVDFGGSVSNLEGRKVSIIPWLCRNSCPIHPSRNPIQLSLSTP